MSVTVEWVWENSFVNAYELAGNGAPVLKRFTATKTCYLKSTLFSFSSIERAFAGELDAREDYFLQSISIVLWHIGTVIRIT